MLFLGHKWRNVLMMFYIFKGLVFPKQAKHHFLLLMLIINPRTKRSYDQGDLVVLNMSCVFEVSMIRVTWYSLCIWFLGANENKEGNSMYVLCIWVFDKGWPGTPCVFEGPMMRRRGRRRGGRSQWTMALVPLIVPLLGIVESENRKRGVAKIVHTYWQGSGMKVVFLSKLF